MTPARSVVLPAVLGAGVVLGLATQPWATGSSADALVGGRAVTASGSSLVPLAGALALAAGAASVVAVTGGRVVRRVAAALLLASALGCAAAIGWFLTDPASPLAADLATRTGRTSPPRVSASATWAAWAALAATLLPTAAGVAALRLAGRTRGLSGRYDSPAAGPPEQALARGESLWDEVSRGDTDDTGGAGDTGGAAPHEPRRPDTMTPDRPAPETRPSRPDEEPDR